MKYLILIVSLFGQIALAYDVNSRIDKAIQRIQQDSLYITYLDGKPCKLTVDSLFCPIDYASILKTLHGDSLDKALYLKYRSDRNCSRNDSISDKIKFCPNSRKIGLNVFVNYFDRNVNVIVITKKIDFYKTIFLECIVQYLEDSDEISKIKIFESLLQI